MRAIHVERLVLIRQQIPCVAGHVNVHAFLRDDFLRRIQNDLPFGIFVADAVDFRQIAIQIRRQQASQRIDAFADQRDVNARVLRQHFLRQRAGVRAGESDGKFRMRLFE